MYHPPSEPAMISYPHVRNGSLVLAVWIAGMVACGGAPKDEPRAAGNEQAAAGPACVSVDSTPVALAVLDYIKAASPLPQRYLSAYGTDSAVPEDGFKVLQAKGPTYFWNGDPKAQAQVKTKLADVGPYTTMLVIYRGKTESDNGNTVTVNLRGHYVGGDHDGKTSPDRAIEVRCDSTAWRLTSPQAPTGKPKAAPAAPTTKP